MTMITTMRREIDEIPAAVRRMLRDSRDSINEAGAMLRTRDPAVLVSIARGSSDHAAHFLKYAFELELGLVVASIGPSLASIYQAPLKLERAVALAISQSGASPDLLALANTAKSGGAKTVCLVNTISSPLAAACDVAVDIHAGPEIAVAATKSFVNSIAAGLSLLSVWSGNAALVAAVEALPDHLEQALGLDWSGLVDTLHDADSLYMLGRGPALAIACEAALKCKETSELHAEAYSSAEVLHGPVSLVSADFPIIAFAARDKAETSIAATANGLAAKNASVFLTSAQAKEASRLPFIETGHPLTDALALIVPYYGMVESLSRARGLNPDKPVALKKVTETR